ncbi:MAG: hypothetical protein D6795_17025 [Deltaproteobacteria bacterium]|nr:MAG: hypothetical protein D6795_17025 [Deltaproteobacteria bacterium]
MSFESEKTMFEIYRLPSEEGGTFEVIYFTELTERNRDRAIARAMRGESFLSGFLRDWKKEEAKEAVAEIVDALNRGESLSPEEVRKRLAPYFPTP